jgi:hypothetical protein
MECLSTEEIIGKWAAQTVAEIAFITPALQFLAQQGDEEAETILNGLSEQEVALWQEVLIPLVQTKL